jgi:hypothetical protein
MLLQRTDLHPAVGVIAGGVAGCVALKLLGGDKSIALYAFVRLLQSAYNDARQRQLWPDDAGPLFNALRRYGDALLFMVTTGQVMFAYVCAPWSLPRSYYHFILNTGPMHEVGLQTMRRRNFSVRSTSMQCVPTTPTPAAIDIMDRFPPPFSASVAPPQLPPQRRPPPPLLRILFKLH